jgi:hypothetical protein
MLGGGVGASAEAMAWTLRTLPKSAISASYD